MAWKEEETILLPQDLRLAISCGWTVFTMLWVFSNTWHGLSKHKPDMERKKTAKVKFIELFVLARSPNVISAKDTASLYRNS